jgi:predicted ATP-grasp superfamily ATP-dependent carboligase
MGGRDPYAMDLRGTKVFVPDGFWRKTLAAVRALGRRGVRVTVGESTRLAPAFFSRYCASRVLTPSPVLDPGGYLDFLVDYLGRNPHDVLLPMEEETLLLLARNRERLEPLVRLPVAGAACLTAVRDKLKAIRRAEALGIPVPMTFEVKSVEEGAALSGKLPYPVVVKPRIGSGSAGVRYVEDACALARALREAFGRGDAPLIQERLPRAGPGLGASFLLDPGGGLRAAFVHRRLREYPVEGGPSTLRESFVHDRVRDDGLRLLRDFGFTGPAMVEFKIDARDGRAKLLEVNPRFWGSLALAVDSGVNFPFLCVLMALGRDYAPVTEYRVGHRSRWLLPGDILHFLNNPRRLSLSPGFFDFRGPGLTYDIIDRKDPWPVLGTLLSLLPYFGRKDFEGVRRRRSVDPAP